MADESTMSSADDFDTVRDIRAKGTRASSADELAREVDILDKTAATLGWMRGPCDSRVSSSSGGQGRNFCMHDGCCDCPNGGGGWCAGPCVDKPGAPAGCAARTAPSPPAAGGAGGASAALPRDPGCFKGGWNDITHKDGVHESFGSCESACTGFDYFSETCGGTHVKCHCISEADLSSKFVNNATRAVDCEMSTPDPVNRANCALDRTFTDSAGNTCKAALSPTVRCWFRRPS